MQLAFASLWLSTLLASGGWDSAPSIACTAAGVFGGTITQLLTIDKNKPTRKVLMGEMLASGFMGFSIFAASGNHEPKVLVAAVIAGGGGSAAYHGIIKRYLGRTNEST